ncbi:hypothetical protein RRG08_061254 [Elysia crispata]|uniref:Uncharacterized protein n=1 Tax=Elysia crispata TaxID=231223 RepID=A0AAE1DGB6_9GAST|nr:hypothetical protein RRG08_061254 [Elysia crispata]
MCEINDCTEPWQKCFATGQGLAWRLSRYIACKDWSREMVLELGPEHGLAILVCLATRWTDGSYIASPFWSGRSINASL